MANLCVTEYIIEGPKETLDRLENALRNPNVRPDSDDRWEGNVILTLGGQINPNYYLRGFISQVERCPAEGNKPNRVYVIAEEAWHKTQFAEALKEVLPDIKIYWYEDTDEGKGTNDREQKYFKIGYLLDAYNDETGNEFYNTYPTKDMLMDVIADEFGITDEDEFDEYEGNGDGHINVYEVDVVDDGLNVSSIREENKTSDDDIDDYTEYTDFLDDFDVEDPNLFESYSKKYHDTLNKLEGMYKQLTSMANALSKEEAKLDKELDKPGKDQKERKILNKVLDSIKDGKKHILRSSESINDACELFDGGIEID